MIRYAFNAVRNGFAAVRGALRGMSDGNYAIPNGLGVAVSAGGVTSDAVGGIRIADGVRQFCAKTAKQKLVPLSAVSHNSVIASESFSITAACLGPRPAPRKSSQQPGVRNNLWAAAEVY